MLPKERMLAALEHREADRVPVGELASDFEMTEKVLGHPTYYRSKRREYVAEWEGRRDAIASSYGHDIVVPESYQIDESQLEPLAYAIKELGGTHLVVGRLPNATFPWDTTVGMEELLVRMVTEPAFVAKAAEAILRPALAWVDAMCDLGVDAIIECADYCGNAGPIMGPQFFRQFILPALTPLARATHARGKYFLKHTDGNTRAILDDLVAIGVNGWQGIQPSIEMDLKRLKDKYAGRLCPFGGVNNEMLIAGTPQDVREEVKHAFRYAAPGGGFVLASGNTLQIRTKYENYIAMLKAGREFSKYPISL